MGFKTIRAKLLFSFFIFFLITVFIVLANIWFESREQRSQKILNTLTQINLEIQMAKKIERDFLSDETINPAFYQDSTSDYLEERKIHIAQIKAHFETLKNARELRALDDKSPIDSIIQKFDRYEKVYDQMIAQIIRRGFKDYGLEGEMRTYIHQIEEEAKHYGLDMGKLLMIRRHEKDFIIRKEDQYQDKIKQAIRVLAQDIKQKVPQDSARQTLIHLLGKYQNTFTQLVQTEQKIGFTKNGGLRKRLANISSQIEQKIKELDRTILAEVERIRWQNKTILAIAVASLLLVIILLAFRITHNLSRPVQELSSSIEGVIQQNFSREADFQVLDTQDEIGGLSRDFALMLEKMHIYLDEIEAKSEKIEKKQRLLMDSIQYAQKIQQAILPDEKELKACFPRFFIIYEPMHVVSGDFYWLARHQGRTYLAVVDCTGHGVPGAFMSMIGHMLLNKILVEQKIYEPAAILEALDRQVQAELHQQENRNNDGMDATICVLEEIPDSTMTRITFAGAKNDLFYIQNHQVCRLKGTRRSVGGTLGHSKNFPFESQQIDLDRDDCIYLSSDGFFDQPNAQRRRFGVKRFIEILENHHYTDMPKQKAILSYELKRHMPSSHLQRDDITMVGIRL